ncbi:MAG: hypothetical protein AAFU85_29520 [Planctomycetota bacterium]
MDSGRGRSRLSKHRFSASEFAPTNGVFEAKIEPADGKHKAIFAEATYEQSGIQYS